jgi:hypothetical protein
MRSYTNEHRDAMPSIDISLLKHVCYVFDGLMFYLRTKNPKNLVRETILKSTNCSEDSDLDSCPSEESDDHETVCSSQEDDEYCIEQGKESCKGEKSTPKRGFIKNPCTRSAPFFRRSDSTVCLGGRAPDPFASSLDESLPLVSKPHLLQPHSRVQDMFRVRSNQENCFVSLNRTGFVLAQSRPNTPYLCTRSDGSSRSKKNRSYANNNDWVILQSFFNKYTGCHLKNMWCQSNKINKF